MSQLVPPPVQRSQEHGSRTAVIDAAGAHSYEELLTLSSQIAAALLGDRTDLEESRIAFLVVPGAAWVATLWAIWRAGGVAVPLPQGSPATELDYVLEDTGASALVFDASSKALCTQLASSRRLQLLEVESAMAGAAATSLPSIAADRRAMILYTSGTTSRPKGVVTTHANIAAQIQCLVDAWEWTAGDRIVLCLPLHHVHGIINVVSCALWSGALCEMLPRFDAKAVWDLISAGRLTLFMAVPTIYVRLITAWEAASPEQQALMSAAARKLRLMVSGSAALPVSTLERWREITGHTLLERYGMTEIGMALSNSYREERFPGCVGRPLPNVDVRLVQENGAEVSPGSPGEIEVRGPNVFLEYWNRPDATRDAYRDGWFRTGDTAVIDRGVYRILGRTSIDILKTGGHKVSALEIEETLREHPSIVECAVVGVPDAEWGERVATALVLRNDCDLSLDELRLWARERMAAHKVPTRLMTLDALPRNAMGKVTKPAVVKLFQATEQT